ncbi:MAG TPA: glycosyltransferase family 2 protein, partial [Alphaproteobacteria bacterium]|nr:glycosyltransferase family 2 protein [Alphaproteobacteria bacterium]
MMALTQTRSSIACAVVTYNRDDFIETCIASLLASRSDRLDVSVIVIDNGSADGTAALLAAYPPEDITVITNAKNVSLSEALNQGIDAGFASGADYIALLNDDIEMRPGAVAELVAVAAEVKGAVVTPLQIDYRKPDELEEVMLKKVQDTPDLLNDAVYRGAIKRYYEQPHGMIGSALVAARETYETIGYFDLLFPFYGSDNDYFTRAARLGRPLLLAMKAHMLHMHGRVSTTKTVNRADWLRRRKSS